MCSIHIMERYSGLKRNKVLIHTTIWMNLENIMLNEVKPVTKGQIRFHVYKVPRIVKFTEI